MQLPIKFWASSVTSTLTLLKSEPASKYAKHLENFQAGKPNKKTNKSKTQPQRKTKTKNNQATTKISKYLG